MLDELVDCYEALGRYDESITVMRRALQVGWSGQPDGRRRIAALVLRDGRWIEIPGARQTMKIFGSPINSCSCSTFHPDHPTRTMRITRTPPSTWLAPSAMKPCLR